MSERDFRTEPGDRKGPLFEAGRTAENASYGPHLDRRGTGVQENLSASGREFPSLRRESRSSPNRMSCPVRCDRHLACRRASFPENTVFHRGFRDATAFAPALDVTTTGTAAHRERTAVESLTER